MQIPVPALFLTLVLSLAVLGPTLAPGETVQAAELVGPGIESVDPSYQAVEASGDRIPVMAWTFLVALAAMLVVSVGYLLRRRMGGFTGEGAAAEEEHHDDHAATEPGHATH